MEQQSTYLLTLAADEVPPALAAWFEDHTLPALLASLERLPDGRVVLHALPDVDPTLVARIRKIMAEHADVLRRLT